MARPALACVVSMLFFAFLVASAQATTDRVAYQDGGGFGENPGIYIANSDGTGRHPVIYRHNVYDPVAGMAQIPALSADGSRIAYLQNVNQTSGAYTEEIRLVSTDLNGVDQFAAPTDLVFQTASPGAIDSIEWSPDGQKLLFAYRPPTGTHFDIYSIKTDGTQLTKEIGWADDQDGAVWSGAGTSMAFSSYSNATGKVFSPYYPQVFARNNAGSIIQVTKASSSLKGASQPAFSPDGSRIVFVGDATTKTGTQSDLFVINTSGTGLKRITNDTAYESHPSWSVDGTKILYSRTPPGSQPNVYAVNPDGTGQQRWFPSGTSTVSNENPSYRQRHVISDYTTILPDFSPYMAYDSQEHFFADSAAEATDWAPNKLMRGPFVLADHNSSGMLAASLSLSLLGPSYSDPAGTPATTEDFIDLDDNYQQAADNMHAQLQYGDKIYGRAVRDPVAGTQWLQYWFWYYDDDWNVLLNLGVHEGDWEMIQVRVDSNGTPDQVTYSQHTDDQAVHCAYTDTNRQFSTDGVLHPVVYVANQSHASYLTPGSHDAGGGQTDQADGDSVYSTAPAIDSVISDSTRWAKWPGRWGSGTGDPGTASPHAPGQQGMKWDTPQAFNDQARYCGDVAAPRRGAEGFRSAPPAPKVRTRMVGHRLRVALTLSGLDSPPKSRPALALLTLYGHNHRFSPGARTVMVTRRRLVTYVRLPRGGGPYELVASTETKSGDRSRLVRRPIK